MKPNHFFNILLLALWHCASQAQTSFTGLVNIYEADSLHTRILETNKGFQTIYAQNVPAQTGDILRIRAQVEMTNDTPPYPGGSTTTVGGKIRILANGKEIGHTAAQTNVSFPGNPDWHHMHHMPLWADALYTVSDNETTRIEVQYAVSKPGTQTTVVIEPLKGPETPYGHLVIEQYHHYSSKQAAADSQAYGLVSFLQDRSSNADTFYSPVTAYDLEFEVDQGDIIRLLGNASSQYRKKRAFHGQQIRRNEERISPHATENNTIRQPDLPLWTDAVDRPQTSENNRYTLRMHSLIDNSFGSASILDNGYLYAVKYSPLKSVENGKQLTEAKMVRVPDEDYYLQVNTDWNPLLVYTSRAEKGDILKVTGFSNISLPATVPYEVNGLFRLSVNDVNTQCSKYVTELSQDLLLRGEIFLTIEETGNYLIKLEVAAKRTLSNPIVKIPAQQSGIILERFSPQPWLTKLEFIPEEEISIYPNPATTYISLNGLPQPANISIFDHIGRKLDFMVSHSKRIMLPTGHLPKGCYRVQITGAQGSEVRTIVLK